MHRVHGVEDRISTCFWTGDGASVSTQEEDEAGSEETDTASIQTMDTKEIVKQAGDAGFTELELRQAEEEVLISPSSKKCSSSAGTLAKQIIDKIAETKKKPQPWSGQLLKPRISLPRTIGNAIAKAKVIYQQSCLNIRSHLPSLFHRGSTAVHKGPNPGSEEIGLRRYLRNQPTWP
jgi:hypothetical protein